MAQTGRTMTPDRKPAMRTQFAEPEIILPNSGPGSTLALRSAILDARRTRRIPDARIETLGVVLSVPVLVVLAAVILLALLGYFVMWLCFVGILFVSTVIADVGHRSWHRALPAWVPRALGYSAR